MATTGISRPLSVPEACCWLFVILLPFQDLGLEATPLGVLGSTATLIPIVFHMVWTFMSRGSDSFRINRWMILLLAYFLLLNLANLAYWGTTSLGQSNLYKFVSLSGLYLFFLYPIFFMNFESINLDKAISCALAIELFGIIAGDILHIPQFGPGSFFHFTTNLHDRFISFAPEPSIAGNTIACLTLAYMQFARSRTMRWLVLASAMIALAFVGSKGTMLCLAGTFVFAQLFLFRNISWKAKLSFLLVGGVVAAIAVMATWHTLFSLKSATTVTTRSLAPLAALLLLINIPSGVGFTGYLPAYREFVPQAILFGTNIIRSVLGFDPGLNEILRYVNQNSSSSIIFQPAIMDFGACFGIPGLILFGWITVKIYRGLKQQKRYSTYLLLAFVFMTFSLLTYIYHLRGYAIPFIYALAWQRVKPILAARRLSTPKSSEPTATPIT